MKKNIKVADSKCVYKVIVEFQINSFTLFFIALVA